MAPSDEELVELLRDASVFIWHVQTLPDAQQDTLATAAELEERLLRALDQLRARRATLN